MILTNGTFLNGFLCNYNWHRKDSNSTAKKQIKHLYTNFEFHYTSVSFEKSVI